jgi:hypothetical protein
MIVIASIFFIIVSLHAASFFPLDDSTTETLFSITRSPDINLNEEEIFESAVISSNDGIEGPYIFESGYESEEPPILDSFSPVKSFTDASLLVGENLPEGGYLYDTFEMPLADDLYLGSSINAFDPAIASATGYDLEDQSLMLDSAFISSSCDDSSLASDDFLATRNSIIETEDLFAPEKNDSAFEFADLLAEYYYPEQEEEKSFIYLASSENPDPDLTKARKSSQPKRPDPRNAKAYQLDPNTLKWTFVDDAYADDGTPIQQGKCLDWRRQACCQWDLNGLDPFSQCWWIQNNDDLCRFAKSRSCCRDLEASGGKGIDCQQARWVKSKDASRQPRQAKNSDANGNNSPSSSFSENELQELFPILLDLPSFSDRNPAYCRPRRRSLK